MIREEHAWEFDGHTRHRVPVIRDEPSLNDSPKEIVRDIIRLGFLEPVRELLKALPVSGAEDRLEILREIAIELSCARNLSFAVDVLAFVTGANDYASLSLREYAEKHGCSHEWIRREAHRMRVRLGIPEQAAVTE